MINIIENNAYRILGLDPSATQKDLMKRSKEILSHIKIDDYPTYDVDFNLPRKIRSIDSVKEALQRLQVPKKKIIEYFFWFQINDAIDEKAFVQLKANNYQQAINIWQEASAPNNSKSFNYKKNLAILYCFLLSSEDTKEYLNNSISIWKELINTQKFWDYFIKVYQLHDDVSTSQEIINSFKDNVSTNLSDFYAQLHKKYENDSYITNFQEAFSRKGEIVEKTILDPVFQKILKAIDHLEKMDISEDGVFDPSEKKKVKKCIRIFQSELNKLIDLGLYDDSQTKTIRDRAANGIRTIVLDIYNNLSEMDIAKKLLEIAIIISGTDSMKNKLEEELEQIGKSIQTNNDVQLVIEIPGFSKDKVIFRNLSLQYGKQIIPFKDINEIVWYSVQKSINGIPSGQDFFFQAKSGKVSIDIRFSATFRAKDEHNIAFGRLVSISNNILEPIVIKKLVSEIFTKNNTIRIGELFLNKKGLCKEKFIKGTKELTWRDINYQPILQQGNAVVFSQNTQGKASTFITIPMSEANAVLIPQLVLECIRKSK